MPTFHAEKQDQLADSVGRLVLPSGHVAIFDLEDAELLARYRWHAFVAPHTVYATGYEIGRAFKVGRVRLQMHRLLLQPPAHLDVDHVNGNGLDNRRANLRACTRSQNMANSASPRNTSGYKGVSYHRASEQWRAYVTVDRKQIHLGLFDDPWEAAQAYNAAAAAHWGPFARLNVKAA